MLSLIVNTLSIQKIQSYKEIFLTVQNFINNKEIRLTIKTIKKIKNYCPISCIMIEIK